MSDLGPPGGDPFRGVPFFGDLARMFQGQGPLNWDAARQFALSIASGGVSEPNVDPMERMRLEELARVAELHVSNVTGLDTSVTGRGVTVVPVTRSAWAQRSTDAFRPLFERLAATLAEARTDDEDADGGDPAAALFGGLIQLLAPVMLGMAAGSMVGHLAERSFGQYDLPVPRPPSDELLLVTANLDRFGEEWSLPPDDLRLWVCLHEIAHHAVLGVPHVRARLTHLLGAYMGAFRAGSPSFDDLDDIDPTNPQSLAALQDRFSDPELLLGAIQTPEQVELLARLGAVVAGVEGYVDHVMDRVGTTLIGSYGRLTEALRRRRVEASASDRFVERLLGLSLDQATYDRGSAFVAGVVERAGEEGLALLWAAERNLPTPAELDAPGLWLARIELVD